MILLDTNLLTRMTRSHEPQAGVARAAQAGLWLRFFQRRFTLTFNVGHFRGLPVTVLDPASP